MIHSMMTSNDGLKESSSKNNGRCIEEGECIRLNNSSVVGEENNMKMPG